MSGRDPRSGTAWSDPGTVESFVRSAPNDLLLRVAAEEWRCGACAIDVGCGAGRNTLPLAQAGWTMLGIDLSMPMLEAAARRAAEAQRAARSPRVHLARATMDALPAPDACFDLVVAHGIWNLARSAAEFRRATREAARVAKPGAAAFVFTFSRHTLPPDAQPLPGEPFAFTQFSGAPQCFLTAAQLTSEMHDAGFDLHPRRPLREHNRPPPGAQPVARVPVIYEGVFRRRD